MGFEESNLIIENKFKKEGDMINISRRFSILLPNSIIATTKDTNIVDIETSVKPSNLEIEYFRK